MRTLSLNLREELFNADSGEYLIFLLTITHPSLEEPIRLTSDATERLETDPDLIYGTNSRGETYYFIGMQIVLPSEQEKSPPNSKLVISNVDRSIIPLIRSITSPAEVLIEAVRTSDPETVEFTIPKMEITHATYDADQISFDLTIDALAAEPYPADSFTPGNFGGLFN